MESQRLTTPHRPRQAPLTGSVRPAPPFRIIGESPVFIDTQKRLARVARSDAPLLIEGETGSGKEVAARSVHYGGPRADAPFVPINCGALPEALFESELFGHERGAFTDARERRRGLVAEAEGGTLFLDEVDALAHKAQVALLRFLQDQCFRPLGAAREHQGNVRLIAASNRPLESLVTQGLFRQDLLYRLKVLQVALPPLRARGRDAALLAAHFAERYARKYGAGAQRLEPSALAWVVSQPWPGNIRELENWVHRQVLMCEGPAVAAPLAAAPGSVSSAPVSAGELPCYQEAKAQAIAEFERAFLARALQEAGGNVSLAAERVGKERRAFGKLLKKHGIGRDTGHSARPEGE
jgi:DNA-binding NtrC family response regulator